ncbi:hypothetical protein UFOVP32_33 [uncultured Caudovirales phage]|uniref:Uncharacterized protein n=1 Tax=uncultured Caudovirales phage TaxID=2100421 RepID=A0A6J5KQL4_9CAUD|nr:hypothetical protein UFOVP32_33 [uncultured Caudovirales phage]CAB4123691.1 hypothetical protein UFOVP50_43 [uncultured Caudovirales phage]
MTDLTAALATIRPALADRYARQVRAAFGAMVEKHGPALNGISNSWDFARTFRALVSPVLASRHRMIDECAIDDGKLAKAAADYAETAVAQWLAKIESKLGDLEGTEIQNFGGCRYTITGDRAGKRVAIEQDVIIKSSTKGLLFNQFPARIYVDGKFTSEAKYKAMF